jgi:hypothetical protein
MQVLSILTINKMPRRNQSILDVHIDVRENNIQTDYNIHTSLSVKLNVSVRVDLRKKHS